MNVIEPKSDGEFPMPKIEPTVSPVKIDEHGFLIADVEFPMPANDTAYYDDDARKAAEARAAADAKTVTEPETKVVQRSATTTKSVK